MADVEIKELDTLLIPGTDRDYWRFVLGYRLGFTHEGRYASVKLALRAMLREESSDRGPWVHRVVLGVMREVLPIAIERTNPADADRFRAVASMSEAASLAYECRRDCGDWRRADRWWTGAAEMLLFARAAALHAQQAAGDYHAAAWWSWAEAARAAARAVRKAADVLDVRCEVLAAAVRVGLAAYEAEGRSCACGRESGSAA